VVIDAQGQGRVFDCVDLAQRVYFEGLTITGGVAVTGWFEALGAGVRCLNSGVSFKDCLFTNNTARIGGGVGCSESLVDIYNCVFLANSADHDEWAGGGGLWCRDSAGALENCTFDSNTAFSLANPDDPGDAGGAFFNHSQFTLTDCTFIGNATGAGAGGFYSVDADISVLIRCHFADNEAVFGGGVFLEQSYAILMECTFQANTAYMGGAMDIDRYSLPQIIDCTFNDNIAIPWEGGAIASWRSTPQILGCTFEGNFSAFNGGAILLGSSRTTIEECIFSGNQANGHGGALSCLNLVDLTMTSCTLVGNTASIGSGIYLDEGALVTAQQSIIAFSPQGESVAEIEENTLTLICCDIFGNIDGDWVDCVSDQYGSSGNFTADPMFCALESNDLTLHADSPCLPGNHPQGEGCGLIGTYAVGCAVTAAAERLPAIGDLEQNQPNPFNPRTAISYSLVEPTWVQLRVYDLSGRLVRRLVEEAQVAPGRYTVTWNGRDDADQTVAAGIYVYRLSTAAGAVTRQMTMVR
jgi:predicted outer membrane repeat protein